MGIDGYVFNYCIRDNAETLCREYWLNGVMLKSIPKKDLGINRLFYPWNSGMIYGNENALVKG